MIVLLNWWLLTAAGVLTAGILVIARKPPRTRWRALHNWAVFAVLWLYTGLRAYLAIRGGAIAQHRKWMIRNFSLTFAAVTLRLYLPASMAAGIEFSLAYPLIAWLCWVPNLALVEWWNNSAHNNAFNPDAPKRRAG